MAVRAGDLHASLARGARPSYVGSRSILPRQDPIPRRRFRAVRLVDPARLPSARCSTSLPSPGSLTLACSARVRSPDTLVTRSAPTPLSCQERPIRATRRGLRRPCGRHRRRREDISHRLLQPTNCTSTQSTARLPASSRLAAPSAQVKGSVDAVPPASAGLSTLSFI
jgi:hypothetical protein